MRFFSRLCRHDISFNWRLARPELAIRYTPSSTRRFSFQTLICAIVRHEQRHDLAAQVKIMKIVLEGSWHVLLREQRGKARKGVLHVNPSK